MSLVRVFPRGSTGVALHFNPRGRFLCHVDGFCWLPLWIF